MIVKQVFYEQSEKITNFIKFSSQFNKQIIEFLDDKTQYITLVRLCWRNQKNLNIRTISGVQRGK